MQFDSPSPQATESFAKNLSLFARPGFVILLKGDLGSGKSTFARAFIKALDISGNDFDVPSPSFALIQTYDNTRVPVAHVDLYRLRHPAEAQELGLEELAKTHLVLVEWPQDQFEYLSPDTLQLSFSGTGEHRVINAETNGAWVNILKRNAEIEHFIKDQAGQAESRVFLDGDASSRRYEKVIYQGRSVILMDMASPIAPLRIWQRAFAPWWPSMISSVPWVIAHRRFTPVT
jgi:N-acetylmuramate 1-kinase